MSDNIDNLLSDIYSSESQSQGVKELANLINNLSQLLLKAISQLENRVYKLEQQIGRGGGAISMPRAPGPTATPTPAPAPKPKVASPFGAPTAPQRTPPPPPAKASRAATPMPAPKKSDGPASVAEAASMLGVTLKKAPTSSGPSGGSSGPSFLTTTVSPSAPGKAATPTPAASPTPQTTVDAAAPTGGGGIAGPTGGFRGELAEKLAKRRKKVQEQLESDFEGADLAASPAPQEAAEESTSSELKVDLEEELRNAFSKLKG
ncbi:MAG: hypothetical protein K9W42_00935 [Candidatus Heimdallarchaeota archaeon]|nr:hypothetical protein [Candidatus Heimdallarchaeota archaeon]